MSGSACHIRPIARPTLAPVSSLLLAFVLTISAELALACAFHAQLPDKTIGDHLIESSVVVLAREDPAKQWTFRPLVALKGDAADAKIDLFVPSTTRRRLSKNPGDAVLLSFSAVEGTWRRLAYIRSGDRSLFERMVRNSASWSLPAGQSARNRFFAGLQDNEDRSVQQIALTELDRAPYRDLRKLEIRQSTPVLAQGLWLPFEQPWAPIRILLIGIRGDKDGRALVQKTISAAEKTGWSMHLGAWATALVEMDGEAGVERLRSGFLIRSEKPQQQVEAVLTALAVHGAGGDPELGAPIDTVISMLVQERPELVATVARIFGAQGDYSRATILSDALEKRRLKSPSDIITVATYLSLARQSQQ